MKQDMPTTALALLDDFPVEQHGKIKPMLDSNIFAPLVSLTAEASYAFFEKTIRELFPEAADESIEEAQFSIRMGPLKGIDRLRVKLQEYGKRSTGASWPACEHVKDYLRCTILVRDGDACLDAWERIERCFEVRKSNRGRLKNNLATTLHQPPNMLVNIRVCAPGCTPLVAEVQIWQIDIKRLADNGGHVFYEIQRAASWTELIAENQPKDQQPKAQPRSTRDRALSILPTLSFGMRRRSSVSPLSSSTQGDGAKPHLDYPQQNEVRRPGPPPSSVVAPAAIPENCSLRRRPSSGSTEQQDDSALRSSLAIPMSGQSEFESSSFY